MNQISRIKKIILSSKAFGDELSLILRLVPKNRQRKLVYVMILQAALSIVDVIGIGLIGIIGALSVSGIKSSSPSANLQTVLSFIGIEDLIFQRQVAILGLSAAFFLISKTIVSAYLNKRILRFLSLNTSQLSSTLFKSLLNTPSLMLDGNSSQRTLYAITQGVQSLNVGAIGSLMNIVSESMLLTVLTFGLFIYDPILAIGTLTFFCLGAIILYLKLHKRARLLGLEYSQLTIDTNEIFIESRKAYREIFVRNQLPGYFQNFKASKDKLAINVANSAFMPLISKYAIEATLILGALFVTALQFTRGNAEQAAASLGVFFATSTRLAPSILRMQQSLLSMRIALNESKITLDFICELRKSSKLSLIEATESLSKEKSELSDFKGVVHVKGVSVRYREGGSLALNNINFTVPAGSFTAIVGPSGAGKSTLADCILGIIKPISGQVTICGQSPIDAIKKWEGKVAYVPQESYISSKSVIENVSFNLNHDLNTRNDVSKALESANALHFVRDLAEGLDTKVGEQGSLLSGGQRQRIGIARALFTKPELLVLDEATSSLDSVSEAQITETLAQSRGHTTLIVIAHRLSTIKLADQVIYLDAGEIRGTGTFDELIAKNERFAAQVEAMRI